jgi:hypothetical protein
MIAALRRSVLPAGGRPTGSTPAGSMKRPALERDAGCFIIRGSTVVTRVSVSLRDPAAGGAASRSDSLAESLTPPCPRLHLSAASALYRPSKDRPTATMGVAIQMVTTKASSTAPTSVTRKRVSLCARSIRDFAGACHRALPYPLLPGAGREAEIEAMARVWDRAGQLARSAYAGPHGGRRDRNAGCGRAGSGGNDKELGREPRRERPFGLRCCHMTNLLNQRSIPWSPPSGSKRCRCNSAPDFRRQEYCASETTGGAGHGTRAAAGHHLGGSEITRKCLTSLRGVHNVLVVGPRAERGGQLRERNSTT